MKTIFYITGGSRGIGKALVESALKTNNYFVYGISREQSVEHERYKHVALDLSNTNTLNELELPFDAEANKVVLINNAGMLGKVSPFGRQDNESIIKTHTINAIAPAVLSNWIIKKYSDTATQIVILNVSSGAARYPVAGWGNYCSSKASVDMLSKVIALENSNGKVKVFAVAPGIVDTQMQAEIRQASPSDFSDLQRFKDYKKNGQLSDAQEVAENLMRIVNHPEKHQDTLLDVRKL